LCAGGFEVKTRRTIFRKKTEKKKSYGTKARHKKLLFSLIMIKKSERKNIAQLKCLCGPWQPTPAT
jgi:hypothetical protein